MTTNLEIVKRIREARIEQNKTQQDLANVLGKTPAAISDMERGKVQVSASDLFLLAKFLQKPIGYFYGENIDSQEIEKLAKLLRNQPPEGQKQAIDTANMLLEMQDIGKQISANPDKEISNDELKIFLLNLIALSKSIGDMNNQLIQARDITLDQLKKQGVDINKFLGLGD